MLGIGFALAPCVGRSCGRGRNGATRAKGTGQGSSDIV